MSWIEIMNLIVALWPLILKILAMISEAERDRTLDAITNNMGRLLTGDVKVAKSEDAVTFITAPLLA